MSSSFANRVTRRVIARGQGSDVGNPIEYERAQLDFRQSASDSQEFAGGELVLYLLREDGKRDYSHPPLVMYGAQLRRMRGAAVVFEGFVEIGADGQPAPSGDENWGDVIYHLRRETWTQTFMPNAGLPEQDNKEDA